jgi:hypothetical protein
MQQGPVMRRFRFLTILGALVLAACSTDTEVLTVGGSKAYLAEPVAIDVVEAHFNIPFLLPQIDSVQKSLRDNGTVVQEAYFAGDARIAVVEHVYDSWFNHISIESVQDANAFLTFLSNTPLRSRKSVVHEASGIHTVGYLAQDGSCVAFRFLKRVKEATGYNNDVQDPDTFVMGYTCDADGEKFIELFGFMTAEDKARVDRRNSI